MIYIKRVVFCLLISEIRFLSHSKEDFLFPGTLKVEVTKYPTQGRVSFFSLCSVLTSQYSLPIYFFPIFKSPHTFFPFHFLYLGTYPYFFS